MPVDESQFYQDQAEFNEYVDNLKATLDEAAGKPKKKGKRKATNASVVDEEKPKRGKKRKREEAHVEEGANESVSAPPKKKGRPRKHPLPDPDAPPKKRGRPRKYPLPEDAGVTTAPAAVGGDAKGTLGESVSTPIVPKKRGRPRKHPLPEDPTRSAVGADGGEDMSVATFSAPAAPKKRGRPRKHLTPEETSAPVASPDNEAAAVPSTPAVSKKRGRPRKHPLPEVLADDQEAPNARDSVSQTDEVDEEGPQDLPIVHTALVASDVPPEEGLSEPLLDIQPTEHMQRTEEVEEQDVGKTVTAAAFSPLDEPAADELASTPAKRRRGRSRKYPLPEEDSTTVPTLEPLPNISAATEEPSVSATTAPKRRGRPPKLRIADEAPKTLKRRGRPAKNKPQEICPESTEDQELPDNPVDNDDTTASASATETQTHEVPTWKTLGTTEPTQSQETAMQVDTATPDDQAGQSSHSFRAIPTAAQTDMISQEQPPTSIDIVPVNAQFGFPFGPQEAGALRPSDQEIPSIIAPTATSTAQAGDVHIDPVLLQLDASLQQQQQQQQYPQQEVCDISEPLRQVFLTISRLFRTRIPQMSTRSRPPFQVAHQSDLFQPRQNGLRQNVPKQRG